MNTILQGILIGAGGTLIAAFIAFVASRFLRRVNLPVDVCQLQRGVLAVLRENGKQNECLAAILIVENTILEVIRDGKINGNIAKAFDKHTIASTHLSVANEIISEFTQHEATGTVKAD